jgi:hypothetical protein
MAKANRTSWERESIFDDLFGAGISLIPKHKFVYLADQTNICPSVLRVWLEHWREYMDDQDEDLEIVMVMDSVVLWRQAFQQKNGEPKSLSAALAAAS